MNKFDINIHAINQGIRINQHYLIDDVIPELERQAIKILINAELVDDMLFNPPGPEDGDAWRLFWVNEALQQDPDGGHLSQTERAAVNVLTTASNLRESLHHGNSDKAASLSVLMLSDAIMGSLLPSNT
jgi:hypothetical protein